MTAPVPLTVNDRVIHAPENSSLLSACLDAGVMIPHLCRLKSDTPDTAPASCRLCLMEVEGLGSPVTSCTTPVKEGMVVYTDTPALRELQIQAFKFLISVHRIDCKHCPANKSCALQAIGRYLGVGLSCKPYDSLVEKIPVNQSHPVFDHYPDRCVHCGICIRICAQVSPLPLLTFIGRGINMQMGYSHPGTGEYCRQCKSCIEHCPTGALVEKSSS